MLGQRLGLFAGEYHSEPQWVLLLMHRLQLQQQCRAFECDGIDHSQQRVQIALD